MKLSTFYYIIVTIISNKGQLLSGKKFYLGLGVLKNKVRKGVSMNTNKKILISDYDQTFYLNDDIEKNI